jgi:hypothetical protein
VTDSTDQPTPAGKGQPTPSRKEREAANKRPLVPTSAKKTKAERRKLADQRAQARAGFEAGEERYLPVRDKGPQRRFARDFVDARFTAGEFMIPMMFAVIIATLIPNYNEVDGSGGLSDSAATVQLTVLIGLYGFFAVGIVDALLMSRKLAARLTEKFGEAEKGIRLYAGIRAFQFRPLRAPKPQVRRGEHPQ